MLETLQKIRKYIALGLGVPALLCVGVGATYNYFAGEGDLVVVAPPEGEVSVQIDSAQVRAVTGHQKFSVKQGDHTVRLTSEGHTTERKVKVSNGFARLLLPADDAQCFVLLDVSKSNYEFGNRKGERPPLPTVKNKIRGDAPFDLPAGTYFSEEELPSTIKEHSSCNLLEQVPCELLARPEPELLAELGF